MVKRIRWIPAALVCAVVLMSGCASGPQANPKDPLEPMNRSVYRFNEAVDGAVLKPVAKGYKNVTPELVQKGVRNVFNNFSDVGATVNNALQLKGRETVESFMRVLVNTTVGICGVFDVATYLQIDRHSEDFGQTLGYWGVPSGPYVVLPFFGPSSLRDGTANFGVDTRFDVVRQLQDVPTRNTALSARLISKRADLFGADAFLDQAALDKYSFMRDAYLQYRRSQIHDGHPPEEELTQPDAAKAK
jgi:phospholipid-binding lipoprotein MlaA